MFFRSLVVAAFVLSEQAPAFAGACCGGASALPALITGDDRLQLGVSASNAEVIGDAPVVGIPEFRRISDNESISTLSLSGAYRLGERFQAGLEVPLQSHARSTPSAAMSGQRLGDLKFYLGFEALPELEYSTWKPKIFLFGGALAPTGRSVYESQNSLNLDVTGRGAWAYFVGWHLVKTIGAWDAYASTVVQRFLASKFVDQEGRVRVGASWGTNIAFGLGWSPGSGDWRFGVSLNPLYEGPKEIEMARVERTSETLIWNTSAQISYLPFQGMSLTVAYSDQTLFGPARNALLMRNVSVGAQRRWEL